MKRSLVVVMSGVVDYVVVTIVVTADPVVRMAVMAGR
jgi:hypothetical protein